MPASPPARRLPHHTRSSLDGTLARAVQQRADITLLAPGGTLSRLASEQQFAVSHEGQVESTQVFVSGEAQLGEADVDEFVLWNFLVNSTLVRRGHKKGLEPAARRWASELAEDPNLRIRVLGYASVTGGATLNDDLARRRAESVRDFLVSLGVPDAQVVIDSSGSRLPMDEGLTGAGLARNRRVEVSKFVATRVRGSAAELGATITASDMRLEPDGSRVGVTLDGNSVTFSLAKQSARLNVRLRAADPNVEVGFVHLVTRDVRQGLYSEADQDGDVANVKQPPVDALDLEHCLDAFTPCRDVQFARLPTSQANGPGQPRRTARTTPAPVEIAFDTTPQIVLPHRIELPGRRAGVLTRVLWGMTWHTLLVVRNGADVFVVGGERWEIRSFFRLVAGAAPLKVSPLLDDVTTMETSTISDRKHLPDIARAMSMPTCDLREKMIGKLCRLAPIAVAPLGIRLSEEVPRARERLEAALGRTPGG